MSDESTREQRLTYDEVDLVLRRAAELEHGEPKGEGSFTLAEVERLGEEIGLSGETIRAAMVHVRSGALAEVEPTRPTLADRFMGPAQLVIRRRVDGPAAEVWARINAFMTEQLLVVKRNFGERVMFGPTESLMSQFRRALDLGNRYTLRGAEEIEAAVLPRPGAEGKVDVVLIARFPKARRSNVQGAIVGSTILVGLGVGGAVVLAPLAMVGSVAAAVGGAGLGAMVITGSRRSYREQVGSVQLALERLLDALEHER